MALKENPMESGLTPRQSPGGFPFRELVAVVLILGLLAGIAVPLFLDQRKKGHDAAAKASLNTVATAITSYIATNDELPTVTVTDSTASFGFGNAATLDSGVILGELTGTIDTWCIDDKQPHGDRAKVKGYKYLSTKEKVEEGQCD